MSSIFIESPAGQFVQSEAGTARATMATCVPGGFTREGILWIRKWYTNPGSLFPPFPANGGPLFTDLMDIDLSQRLSQGAPGGLGLYPYGRWRLDFEFTQYYPLNPNVPSEISGTNGDWQFAWVLFFSRGPKGDGDPGDVFSGSASPLIPAASPTAMATIFGPYRGQLTEFTDLDNPGQYPLLPIEFRMINEAGTHFAYKIPLSGTATPTSPAVFTGSLIAPPQLTACYRGFDVHMGITQRREQLNGLIESPIVLNPAAGTVGASVSRVISPVTWAQALFVLPEEVRALADALPFWQMRFTVTRLGLVHALFQADKHYQDVPKRVRFTAIDERAITFNWNFGDGNSSTAIAPVHNYAAAGTYSVTLTVTSSTGDTAAHTAAIILIA